MTRLRDAASALRLAPAVEVARQRIRAWKVEARAVLARWRRPSLNGVRFIAITGSAGKTTTTELLGAILQTSMPCRIGSQWNSVEGIVTTILVARPADGTWVQEVSGGRPGAISESVALLRPTVGIVTTIGDDHRKAFKTREGIAAEKGKLVERLPPTGLAVLNADDPLVLAMASRTPARVVTYGRSSNADIVARDVKASYPDTLSFLASVKGAEYRVETRLFGEQWVTPVLAALACSIELGVEPAVCLQAIAAFPPVFNRCSLHQQPNGVDLILDAEKASAWTVAATLALLAGARARRKSLVVGSLSDITGASGVHYRRVAKRALEVADRVIFVGRTSAYVSRLQAELGPALVVIENVADLPAYLSANTVPGELVVVKANSLDRLGPLLVPSHSLDLGPPASLG